MNTLLRVLVLISLLLITSCKKGSNLVEPSSPNSPGTSGAITTGTVLDGGAQTIPPSGGTFTVNKAGDPLNGFQIAVPPSGFSASKTFTLSYATITAHQFGDSFNPVSPLITISYEGGYSSMPMQVKVPITLPAGSYAMGFLYDDVTGKLEALPTVRCDGNSITVATRHFTHSGQALGKGLRKATEHPYAKLVVSSALESYLAGHAVISSGFTPGTDDWEFPNEGSYIQSKGHCSGQSMTAIWYYYIQKLGVGEHSLFHQFDKLNNPADPEFLWFDNPHGIRLASIIQSDYNFDDFAEKATNMSRHPDSIWRDFISAMLRDGSPQMLFAMNSTAHVAHAMVVYKIDVVAQILYVADPNYPGNIDPATKTSSVRQIRYQGGVLQPYASALAAGQPGYTFDKIVFGAKTAYIDWSQIANRWVEFLQGTIGNDKFPAYTLLVTLPGSSTDSPLVDGLDVKGTSIQLKCSSTDVMVSVPGSDHLQYLSVYDAAGNLLIGTTASNHGLLQVPLAPGSNTLGLAIFAKPDISDSVFVDFKWVTVHRQVGLTITTTEIDKAPLVATGLVNKAYTFVASSGGVAPKSSGLKYTWSFGDGTGQTVVNNDSTVVHTFTQAGVDTVKLTLTDAASTVGTASVVAQIATSTQPVITAIRPDTARPGELVTIIGSNLGAAAVGYVYIPVTNGYALFGPNNVISYTSTQVKFLLPQGTISGDIYIVNNTHGSNHFPFTVDMSPAVDSIYVATRNNARNTWGMAGDLAFIDGKNLQLNSQDVTTALFGSLQVSGSRSTWGEVQARIPAGLSGTVNVGVLTQAGLRSNTQPFLIGIPDNILKSNSHVSCQFGFNVIYYDSLKKKVDTTFVSANIAPMTGTWSGNVFSASWTDASAGTSGTISLTIPQPAVSITSVDLLYKYQASYWDAAHRVEVHYKAQNMTAWTSSSSGGYFSATTPAELARVSTSITGYVVGRTGLQIGGNPIQLLLPTSGSVYFTLSDIKY
jgi:PKD repeat protein